MASSRGAEGRREVLDRGWAGRAVLMLACHAAAAAAPAAGAAAAGS